MKKHRQGLAVCGCVHIRWLIVLLAFIACDRSTPEGSEGGSEADSAANLAMAGDVGHTAAVTDAIVGGEVDPGTGSGSTDPVLVARDSEHTFVAGVLTQGSREQVVQVDVTEAELESARGPYAASGMSLIEIEVREQDGVLFSAVWERVAVKYDLRLRVTGQALRQLVGDTSDGWRVVDVERYPEGNDVYVVLLHSGEATQFIDFQLSPTDLENKHATQTSRTQQLIDFEPSLGGALNLALWEVRTGLAQELQLGQSFEQFKASSARDDWRVSDLEIYSDGSDVFVSALYRAGTGAYWNRIGLESVCLQQRVERMATEPQARPTLESLAVTACPFSDDEGIPALKLIDLEILSKLLHQHQSLSSTTIMHIGVLHDAGSSGPGN